MKEPFDHVVLVLPWTCILIYVDSTVVFGSLPLRCVQHDCSFRKFIFCSGKLCVIIILWWPFIICATVMLHVNLSWTFYTAATLERVIYNCRYSSASIILEHFSYCIHTDTCNNLRYLTDDLVYMMVIACNEHNARQPAHRLLASLYSSAIILSTSLACSFTSYFTLVCTFTLQQTPTWLSLLHTCKGLFDIGRTSQCRQWLHIKHMEQVSDNHHAVCIT